MVARNYHLKMECLRRENFLCQGCGTSDKVQAHHVVPLSQGGKDELSNLKALCGRCHLEAHGKKLLPLKPTAIEFFRIDWVPKSVTEI